MADAAISTDRSSLSGSGPKLAQSRRGPSAPVGRMSNSEIRLPKVSLTISVLPSGVMNEPLGKHSPSATACATPSVSTRTSVVVATGSPAIRSKPKLPT
ncbi:hypothetical protein D3C73_982400 [compost metagenome]